MVMERLSIKEAAKYIQAFCGKNSTNSTECSEWTTWSKFSRWKFHHGRCSDIKCSNIQCFNIQLEYDVEFSHFSIINYPIHKCALTITSNKYKSGLTTWSSAVLMSIRSQGFWRLWKGKQFKIVNEEVWKINGVRVSKMWISLIDQQ